MTTRSDRFYLNRLHVSSSSRGFEKEPYSEPFSQADEFGFLLNVTGRVYFPPPPHRIPRTLCVEEVPQPPVLVHHRDQVGDNFPCGACSCCSDHGGINIFCACHIPDDHRCDDLVVNNVIGLPSCEFPSSTEMSTGRWRLKNRSSPKRAPLDEFCGDFWSEEWLDSSTNDPEYQGAIRNLRLTLRTLVRQACK